MSSGLVQKIDHLPTLPGVLANLMETLDDSRSSAGDIEAILERDQSTTSKLLAVANSSYYGLRHQITTVARAVVVLGMEEVRSICLGTVLSAMLSPRRFPDQASARALWAHSMATQEAARILSERCAEVRTEVALTAGLLHDLGWVVIMGYHHDQWEKLKQAAKAGIDMLEAEEQLGLSHQEAGKALGEHWDLPPMIIEVLSRHHSLGSDLKFPFLLRLIHLADIVAAQSGYGTPGQAETYEIAPEVLSGMGFGEEELEHSKQHLKERMSELDSLWSTMTGN
ncbi:MAG: HDOD domain-containing protein [Desulfarculaceae bacterium]|jgi:HD-like signal output (HDOD) protein